MLRKLVFLKLMHTKFIYIQICYTIFNFIMLILIQIFYMGITITVLQNAYKNATLKFSAENRFTCSICNKNYCAIF